MQIEECMDKPYLNFLNILEELPLQTVLIKKDSE